MHVAVANTENIHVRLVPVHHHNTHIYHFVLFKTSTEYFMCAVVSCNIPKNKKTTAKSKEVLGYSVINAEVLILCLYFVSIIVVSFFLI